MDEPSGALRTEGPVRTLTVGADGTFRVPLAPFADAPTPTNGYQVYVSTAPDLEGRRTINRSGTASLFFLLLPTAAPRTSFPDVP